MENGYLREAKISCSSFSGSFVTYKIYAVDDFLPVFDKQTTVPEYAKITGEPRLYNGSFLFENGGALRHEKTHIKVTFLVEDEKKRNEFQVWLEDHASNSYYQSIK